MVGLGSVSVAFACGGSDANNPFDGPDASGDGGQHDVVVHVFPEVSFADTTKALGCSAHLRNVIDANGTVLQTCPPDQGSH